MFGLGKRKSNQAISFHQGLIDKQGFLNGNIVTKKTFRFHVSNASIRGSTYLPLNSYVQVLNPGASECDFI